MIALIADHELESRSELYNILIQNGINVSFETDNGFLIINKYFELRPDFAIIDLNLPVVNGIEAAKRISLIDPAAKIILVSSIAQESLIIDAFNAGVKDFIVKPIYSDRLVSSVRKMLTKK